MYALEYNRLSIEKRTEGDPEEFTGFTLTTVRP